VSVWDDADLVILPVVLLAVVVPVVGELAVNDAVTVEEIADTAAAPVAPTFKVTLGTELEVKLPLVVDNVNVVFDLLKLNVPLVAVSLYVTVSPDRYVLVTLLVGRVKVIVEEPPVAAIEVTDGVILNVQAPYDILDGPSSFSPVCEVVAVFVAVLPFLVTLAVTVADLVVESSTPDVPLFTPQVATPVEVFNDSPVVEATE
jgi:hypothetical protein